MKRGKPLQRRTRLVTRQPLRTHGTLRRGGPLNPVSDKRRKANRERARMAVDVFGANPPCARCGRPADDLHELLSRARGGSITDPGNCVPLCRDCHDDVTFRHHVIPDADRWVHSAVNP